MTIRWRWVALLAVVTCLGLCGRQAFRIYNIVKPVPEPPAEKPSRDASSLRRIAQGEVVGFRSAHGAHVYRALPFALPPVGALRWRAPRPAAAWSGVREALTPSPLCAQPKARENQPEFAGVLGQEDCLYLDVYAPAMSAAEAARSRLPVMLWIHGGGNLVSGAAQIDASRLAAEQRVIVVATNYRLGPFGWFSHPALAGADPGSSAEDRSGNYGTLDLIQALRWVNTNAASFGGDRGKVTVFGVSAGGGNVLSLLLAPSARGLFQRAISQSAPIYSYSLEQAQAYAEDGGLAASSAEVLARLLVAAGRAEDRAAAKVEARRSPAAMSAEFLRLQTPEALLRALLVPRARGDDRPPEFAAVLRDGIVVPAGAPFEQFARGDYHRVPLMIGTNRDEMKVFMIGNPELTEQSRMGPRVRDEDFYAVLAEYRSEAWRAGTVHVIAPLLSKRGERVYAYRFDWDEQPRLLARDLSMMLGASHALEVPFVFGIFNRSGRARFAFTEYNEPGREQLSAVMRDYWTEFAARGAPGRGRKGHLPEWKPWSERDKFMVLDTEDGGGAHMERHAATINRLLARLAADQRLPEARDKCRVLYWMTHRGRSIEPRRYLDAPGIDCKPFPPERYPWPAQTGG
jgi:para-nitrobenzyl esterase